MTAIALVVFAVGFSCGFVAALMAIVFCVGRREPKPPPAYDEREHELRELEMLDAHLRRLTPVRGRRLDGRWH